MSPTSQTPTRTSLFDSCHRKIRLIGGGPVAFLGGLVAKARRKERDGDQNSTDTKLYLEESVLERKLPEADLKALVDLPAGLDYNEWLASHTLALFEHVNLVYGTISEFCTPSGCPDMTGPGNRTYLWFDEKGKKTRVAAPQYIDYVMTFTQKTVSDESIFPTKYANEFPGSFESIARKILRLQFHVIAHLYAAHFREIALLGLHTHLNLTFAHLTALHRRFTLIDEKETDVLRDLEVALRLTDDNHSSHGHGTGAHANSSSNASHSNTSTMNSGSGGSAITASTDAAGGRNGPDGDDVNLLQQQTTVIDGDAASPPICTQPEANTRASATATAGGYGGGCGGGGGGLITGILGDLTSGEFGDTTRYCTSAVPSSTAASAHDAPSSICNNGAGALHLNFISNNSSSTNSSSASATASATLIGGAANNNHNSHSLHNNNNHNHHNNLHHYHHHHHHHQQQQQQHLHHNNHQQQPQPHLQLQNSGLIQCNASNAPSSAVSVGGAGVAPPTGTTTTHHTTTTTA